MPIIPKPGRKFPISSDQKGKTSDVESEDDGQYFFYLSRIVNRKFVSFGQIGNQLFVLTVLRHLRKSMWRKRPVFRPSCDWFFHHDKNLRIQGRTLYIWLPSTPWCDPPPLSAMESTNTTIKDRANPMVSPSQTTPNNPLQYEGHNCYSA